MSKSPLLRQCCSQLWICMDWAGGQQIAWMALSTGTQCHSGVTEPGTAHRNTAVNSTCSRLFSLVSTYFRWWPSKGQTALSTPYAMWKAFFRKSPIEGKWLLLCPFKEILYYLKARTVEHLAPTLVAWENPFMRPDQPRGEELTSWWFICYECCISEAQRHLYYALATSSFSGILCRKVYLRDCRREGGWDFLLGWWKVLVPDRGNGFTSLWMY